MPFFRWRCRAEPFILAVISFGNKIRVSQIETKGGKQMRQYSRYFLTVLTLTLVAVSSSKASDVELAADLAGSLKSEAESKLAIQILDGAGIHLNCKQRVLSPISGDPTAGRDLGCSVSTSTAAKAVSYPLSARIAVPLVDALVKGIDRFERFAYENVWLLDTTVVFSVTDGAVKATVLQPLTLDLRIFCSSTSHVEVDQNGEVVVNTSDTPFLQALELAVSEDLASVKVEEVRVKTKKAGDDLVRPIPSGDTGSIVWTTRKMVLGYTSTVMKGTLGSAEFELTQNYKLSTNYSGLFRAKDGTEFHVTCFHTKTH
jgi:hypothetical protein